MIKKISIAIVVVLVVAGASPDAPFGPQLENEVASQPVRLRLVAEVEFLVLAELLVAGGSTRMDSVLERGHP